MFKPGGKCEFCEDGKPKRNFNETCTVEVKLVDVPRNRGKCMTAVVKSAVCETVAEIEVRHCPICGRKL